jgi:hypothetical protein
MGKEDSKNASLEDKIRKLMEKKQPGINIKSIKVIDLKKK